MLVHVPEEFELCLRGSDDEEGIDAVERSCRLGEESMRIIRVVSRLPAPFRMPVYMVLRCEDRCFVGRLGVDVEDAGFVVVDPDDCMRWHDRILR